MIKSEINRRNNRDIIKEVYEQCEVKGITLQEFRKELEERGEEYD